MAHLEWAWLDGFTSDLQIDEWLRQLCFGLWQLWLVCSMWLLSSSWYHALSRALCIYLFIFIMKSEVQVLLKLRLRIVPLLLLLHHIPKETHICKLKVKGRENILYSFSGKNCKDTWRKVCGYREERKLGAKMKLTTFPLFFCLFGY